MSQKPPAGGAARFLRDAPPPPDNARLIGQLAIAAKLITQEQLDGALRYLEQERSKGRVLQLGEVLLKFRYLSAQDLDRLLAEQERKRETTPRLASSSPPLRRIGVYEIAEELGRGAMGVVYRAFDLRLKRTVALKVLRDDEISPQFLERFEREAIALARLRHPGIATLYEAGQAQGIHFVAMEFIEGKTLESRLRSVPLRQALQWMEEVARAIHHAHEHQVIHRDLKPGNILIDTQDHPRVVDFGLARVKSERVSLTASGDVLGTPAYMAPEQVRGHVREIDARTDVYALGAILYEILTGRLPFVDQTSAALYQSILNVDPPRPTRIKRTIHPDLEVVSLKALAKERPRRYATALDFAEDLARFLRGEPIRARPPSVGYRLKKTLLRQKTLLLAIGAAAGAGLVGIGTVRILQTRSARKVEERRRTSEHQSEKDRSDARERARPHLEEGRRLLKQAEQLTRRSELNFRENQETAASAIREYKNALAAYPDLPEAHLGLACVYWSVLGEQNEAFQALDRAIVLRPNFTPAYSLRARWKADFAYASTYPARYLVDALSENLLIGVEKDLKLVLELSEDPEERLWAKALAALIQQDPSRAEDALHQLQFRNPEDFSIPYWLGRLYREQKRWGEAEKELRTAESLHPHIAAIPAELAMTLAGKEDFEGAFQAVDRVLKMKFLRADLLLLRAQLSVRLGRHEPAISDCTKALEFYSEYAEAFYVRGEAEMHLKRVPEAIADMTRTLELNPTHFLASVNRGTLHFSQGRWDPAIVDFSNALDVDPESIIALRNRALAYREKGEWDPAIEDCNRILKRSASDVGALRIRAWARSQKGDQEGALADLTQAIEFAPQDPLPRKQRSEVYALLRNFEKALLDATAAIDRMPDFAEAYCLRGLAYDGLDQRDRALDDYSKAIDLKPDYGTAYGRRALLRAKSGDVTEAHRDANRALQLNLSEVLRKALTQLLASAPKSP